MVASIEWSNMLKAVAPTADNSPHAFICKTKRKGGQAKIEVLSARDYQNFYSKNSFWNSSCKQMSLAEIVTISKSKMGCASDDFERLHQREPMKYRLSDFGRVYFQPIVQDNEIHTKNFSKEIEPKIKQYVEIMDEMYKVCVNVRNMCSRATIKHTNQKIQGIWGKIKWFIWSNFFD